jgi:gamma-glutamyltranspeptidase/glutathione hydrolase
MISRRHLLLSAGLASAVQPKAMVSAASGIAALAGVEVLKRGGNAVDAAVAVGMAEAVTWPAAGNIGGGGYMLIQLAGGQAHVIDYREAAPKRAHRNMYVGADGKLDPRLSTAGHLASGVPGTVAGFELAHRKYGKLDWKDCLAPAVKLARDGFTLDETTAVTMRRAAKLLSQFPDSNRIFLRAGKFFETGETLRQPELADTLERIAGKGAAEFYRGGNGAHDRGGDESEWRVDRSRRSERYHAIERVPLRGKYRGYEIVSLPPSASGGAVLIAMLNMLERFDLAKLGPRSPERYHLLAEQ